MYVPLVTVQVGLVLFKNAYHGGPLLILLTTYHLLKGNCMCDVVCVRVCACGGEWGGGQVIIS